jgi:uncharacterized protein DUF4232
MPCSTDAQSLGLRVAGETGGMSHGVVVFAVTNKSSFRCSIGGYPGVGFSGGTFTKLASGRLRVDGVHRVRAEVHDGDVWSCPDGGQHRLVLVPGGSAYFAVGTATAYGGPELDLSAMRVQLPGSSHARMVDVLLFADAPAGRPLPAEVTALRTAPWAWMP